MIILITSQDGVEVGMVNTSIIAEEARATD